MIFNNKKHTDSETLVTKILWFMKLIPGESKHALLYFAQNWSCLNAKINKHLDQTWMCAIEDLLVRKEKEPKTFVISVQSNVYLKKPRCFFRQRCKIRQRREKGQRSRAPKLKNYPSRTQDLVQDVLQTFVRLRLVCFESKCKRIPLLWRGDVHSCK